MTPIDHALIHERIRRAQLDTSIQIGVIVSAVAFGLGMVDGSWKGILFGIGIPVYWYLSFVGPASKAWEKASERVRELEAATWCEARD